MKQTKFSLHDFAGGTVLSREQMKNVVGGMAANKPCGVKVNGTWYQVVDSNGNGATKDETLQIFNGAPTDVPVAQLRYTHYVNGKN